MIITVTANPSVDRTITLSGPLTRGGVQRAVGVSAQAGGKGVNISRAAVHAGVPTLAILPAYPDDPFVRELLGAGIECVPSRPAGPIRVNLTITEPDGTTTKLNSPGAICHQQHLDGLANVVIGRAGVGDWVVLAGSLPPGAPSSFYADLVPRLTDSAKVAVDTSEAPLRAMTEALPTSAPALLKPNGHELASLTGADGDTLEADPGVAADAAAMLVQRGVGAVLVTLGSNGAVLVSGEGAWYAPVPATEVVSTVGAGDSALFGYLLGDLRGLTPPERLALSVAYGSAAAGLPGTTIPEPDQVDAARVSVSELGVGAA